MSGVPEGITDNIIRMDQWNRNHPRAILIQTLEDLDRVTIQLQHHGTVELQLGQADAALYRRALDYCSGYVYMMDGQLSRLDTNRYLLSIPDERMRQWSASWQMPGENNTASGEF